MLDCGDKFQPKIYVGGEVKLSSRPKYKGQAFKDDDELRCSQADSIWKSSENTHVIQKLKRNQISDFHYLIVTTITDQKEVHTTILPDPGHRRLARQICMELLQYQQANTLMYPRLIFFTVLEPAK